MPWGAPLCRLRASLRRTGGTDSSGWPTPSATAIGAKDLDRLEERREECRERTGNGNGFGLTLDQAAPLWLAGVSARPTPLLTDGDAMAGGKRNTLSDVAKLAASPRATPKNTDGDNGLRTPEGAAKEYERKGQGADLPTLAVLAAWQTPKANEKVRSDDFMDGREPNTEEALAFGPGSISSRAATAKYGVLNPAFSLWLMGFPSAWLMAVPVKASRGRRFSKG